MTSSFSFRRAVAASALTAMALLAAAPSRTATAAAARVVPTVTSARTSPFHLRLEKSEPANGESLSAAPKAIRLWFSLPPEMAVTAIKLSDGDGNAVTLAAPTRGNGAKDPVESLVQGKLADGSYTVSWKTSSKDGHPIKGDFTFTVKGGAK